MIDIDTITAEVNAELDAEERLHRAAPHLLRGCKAALAYAEGQKVFSDAPDSRLVLELREAITMAEEERG